MVTGKRSYACSRPDRLIRRHGVISSYLDRRLAAVQLIDALINVPEGTTRPKWVQAEAPRLFMAGLMAADPVLRRYVFSFFPCFVSCSVHFCPV